MKKFLLFVSMISFVLSVQLFAQTEQRSEEKFKNINCMGCHDLSKYTVEELKTKLKKYQKGKGSMIMINILNGISDKDIDYLANKYGKK